jgi:hypothetical protein
MRTACAASLLFLPVSSASVFPCCNIPDERERSVHLYSVNSLHRDGAQLSNPCGIEKKITAAHVA